MTVNRKIIAPSNTPGAIAGAAFMNDAAEEIAALWRYAILPLSNVANPADANHIAADCDVPLVIAEKGNNLLLIPGIANTGAAFLSVNGLADKEIVNRDGSSIAAGRLQAGRAEPLANLGTKYALLADNPPAAAGTILKAVFAYQLAQGNQSVAVSAGWQTYKLNTVIRNDLAGLGVALNTGLNQITLPSGAYEFEAQAYIGNFKGGLYLWNVTDNVLVPGQARVQIQNYGSGRTIGQFALASTKILELRVYSSAAAAAGNLGEFLNISSPASIPEQYGHIQFEVQT